MNRSLGTPPQMSREPEPPAPGGKAAMRWGMLAAIAAAGALLLAMVVAPTGSAVAVAGALVAAIVLTTIAAVVLLRARWVGARAGRRNTGVPAPARPNPQRGPLPPVSETRRRPGAAPAGPPAPSAPSAPSGGGSTLRPSAASPQAPLGDQGIPGSPAGAGKGAIPDGPKRGVAAVARELAMLGLQRTSAPAVSVLVVHGRRLVAAGTAGDWALARRLQAETWEDPPGWPGRAAGALNDADPPEFPLDDQLPRLLGLYTRAIPVERWHNLEDAPEEVLPLAGLADRGIGVAIPLTQARQLAGLWVLAQRPKGRVYSDSELQVLERLARQAGPLLAAALASTPG